MWLYLGRVDSLLASLTERVLSAPILLVVFGFCVDSVRGKYVQYLYFFKKIIKQLELKYLFNNLSFVS